VLVVRDGSVRSVAVAAAASLRVWVVIAGVDAVLFAVVKLYFVLNSARP